MVHPHTASRHRRGRAPLSDIYEQRGYGHKPVGFGEKPGLAVVDFKTGFTNPAFPMGVAPMVERAVLNTARLIRTAKAAQVPIIACVVAFDGPKGAPH